MRNTLILLAAASWWTACSPEPTEAPAVAARMLAAEPEQVFSVASFMQPVMSEFVTFDEGEMSRWIAQDLDQPVMGTEGLELRVGPGGRPSLTRKLLQRADEVGSIEVSTGPGPLRRAKLHWTRAGEEFSAERSRRASVRLLDGVLRFELREHPLWSGTIDSLRLGFDLEPGQTLVLRGLILGQHELDQEALSLAMARPWRVALDGQLRSGLLAPPGLPWEWPVQPPPGARLRFGYGIMPQPRERDPVRFRVSVRSAQGTQQLFEARLPDAAASAGWHEAQVDLSSYSGLPVEIIFQTEAEGPFRPARMLATWSDPRLLAPRPVRQPNVLIISLDTLRADHLSLYGHDRPTSPRLDAWARSSAVVFQHCVAPAPWTLPSHASLFSGLDALHHGVNHGDGFGGVPADMNLLAESLREAGYATYASTAGGYLHWRTGLAQGFDAYDVRVAGSASLEEDDELVRGIDQLMSWMDAHAERPFFAFLHTYEIHAPYWEREPWYSQWAGDQRAPKGVVTIGLAEKQVDAFVAERWVLPDESGDVEVGPEDERVAQLCRDLYDSGIAYTDQQIGRLLDFLAQRGLADDTLVVITSDHGESFGEHGMTAHTTLYDENLLVPLLLALPGGAQAGRVVESQVRVVDVMPTVLDACGVQPPGGMDGISLLPLARGQLSPAPGDAWSYAVKTRRGVSVRRDNSIKFIRAHTALGALAGREELYDLDTDPDEQRSLVETRAQAADALRELVSQQLQQHPAGLRLHFVNTGQFPFEGTLRGAGVHPVSVTSPDLPPASAASPAPALEPKLDMPLRYSVAPGARFTLCVETARSEELELTGVLKRPDQPPARFIERIDLGALEDEYTLTFDGQQWQARAAGADASHSSDPVAVGVTLRWHGPRSVSTPELPLDPEQLEQLRVLGYLK